jgi:type II secretory pathway pseudopilin PulG
MKRITSKSPLWCDNRGMFLLELLIVVILISVVATAYLNFHSGQTDRESADSSLADSNQYIFAALKEIGFHLRFACPRFPDSPAKSVFIDNTGESDRIKILHNGIIYEYLVDNNNQLIRRMASKEDVLADNVISLKALPMGNQTIVITLTVKTPIDIIDSSGEEARSFSEVVTTNYLL